MQWLNYHHLYYFWVVASEGSITTACKRLRLAQPTISAQIKALETEIGQNLFERVGRRLKLTVIGQTVYRYADDIFTTGQELTELLEGRTAIRPARVVVGIADVLPKLVAFHLVQAAMDLDDPVQVICYEGQPSDLLARLSVGELDVVLSDAPASAHARVRAYSHELGSCGLSFFASPDQRDLLHTVFPDCLDGMPFLLPCGESVMRRELEMWFNDNHIRPEIVGEFEDSALLKVFGQAGYGMFAAPSVIEDTIIEQHEVEIVGRTDDVQAKFYAISVERQVRHPGVKAIIESAKGWM